MLCARGPQRQVSLRLPPECQISWIHLDTSMQVLCVTQLNTCCCCCCQQHSLHKSNRHQTLRPVCDCVAAVSCGNRHSFVSAYDFGPWPLLEGVTQLPATVTEVGMGCICRDLLLPDMPQEFFFATKQQPYRLGCCLTDTPVLVSQGINHNSNHSCT